MQALEVAINSVAPATRNAANFKHNHMYGLGYLCAYEGVSATRVFSLHGPIIA